MPNTNGPIGSSDPLLQELIEALNAPLASIEGWVATLEAEHCDDVRFQGLEAIDTRVKQIRALCETVLQQAKQADQRISNS